MYKIINSDVYSGLSSLLESSIDVAVTSPPYWGQRDYGFDNQIGNEDDYQEYISKLVIIFNVLRKKLSDTGVFFLNIGDKYISKYGKTPIGLIPYRLAYEMQNDGWFLNDVIIWFKPNHMPSSIKNRFINSYEPVFVFSKTRQNIYNFFIKKTGNNSNILKIPLQPTPFKHVAVYPEKLVFELLKKVELPINSTILDPFAGSGTTLKVIIEHFRNCNAVMIECNEEYIKIIKDRCRLNGNFEIQKFNFISYYTRNYKTEIFENKLFNSDENLFSKNEKNGFIKIFENKNDYYYALSHFTNHFVKFYFNKNATFFIGCKCFDNELIFNTSKLNSNGWVIRNMIVFEENNRWFPIFMIVDDNKLTDYTFNYKNLMLKSKKEYERDWNETDFCRYKVVDTVSKVKKEGKVVEVLEKLDNGFPKYLVVEWEENNFTKEYVVSSQEQINKNLIMNIGNDSFQISEVENLVVNKKVAFQKFNDRLEIINGIEGGIRSRNYNGKFKGEKRINFGASPGARSSIDEEYFSLQRLYEVDQNLIADYLNEKRKQKGLTKQELTNCFPLEYRHTVGHWLRKDFGGSLPTPDDWNKLSKILDLDENIENYICKTALRIQTVKNAEFKMPDDFQQLNFIERLELLIKH